MKSILFILLSYCIYSPLCFSQAAHDKNVITFGVTTKQTVTQDTLTVRLQLDAHHPSPTRVAEDLAVDSEKLLSLLAHYPELRIQHSQLHSYPRYDSDASHSASNTPHRPISWHGQRYLTITTQSFDNISRLLDDVIAQQAATIQSIQFHLSDELTQTIAHQLTEQAITLFRQRAQIITTQFGYQHYDIVTIDIQSNPSTIHRPQVLRTASPLVDGAGSSEVTITLLGSIQLHSVD